MDALENVLVFIWNIVHGKDIESDEQVGLLKQVVQSSMYPFLSKEELQKICKLKKDSKLFKIC